jgi:predicted transcriptional regulator
VARLITYLKDVENGSARDIEMATGLRQPEVSMAMQPLRGMGWISEHELKNPGKSSPMKIYALGATVEDIIKHYETEKNQESARTVEAIQRLKKLSSSNIRRPLRPLLFGHLGSQPPLRQPSL